jgi:hypothetical protein
MSWVATGLSVASGVMGMMGGDDDGAKEAAKASAAAQRAIKAQAAENTKDFKPYKDYGSASTATLMRYLGLGGSAGTRGDYVTDPMDRERFIDYAGYHRPDGARDEGPEWLGHENANIDRAYQLYLDGLAVTDPSKTDPNYGSLMKKFSNEDFVKDPGYEFRLAEGEKGINRAAASRGGYDSGTTLKALLKYNQDYGSNEFNNAFNRDNTNKNTIYSFLSGGTQTGLNATSNNASLNSNLVTAGANMGQEAGNTQAQLGMINSDNKFNAFNSAISNGIYGYNRAKNAPVVSGGGYSGGANSSSMPPWYMS